MNDALELKKLIWQRFRLSFRRPELLLAALTHPSWRNENLPVQSAALDDFDRLEFFGDSILNLVVCKQIFFQYPAANEGELSRLRSTLVSRKILFRVARELGFLSLLRVSRNLKQQPVSVKIKVLADAFESFLGALFLDQGLDRTEKFILKHLAPYFDVRRLERLDPNPKSSLQELALLRWKKLPVYQTEMTRGEIKTTVSIGRTRQARATGKSKQESEQKAAGLLLRKLRQEASRPKRRSSRKKVRKAP